MTNKPMLSVERELLEELRNVCGDPNLAAEANAILDKPSVQLHGEPVAVVMPDVDELAQIIRKVDGSHTLGAGSLAEAIIEEVSRLNRVKP